MKRLNLSLMLTLLIAIVAGFALTAESAAAQNSNGGRGPSVEDRRDNDRGNRGRAERDDHRYENDVWRVGDWGDDDRWEDRDRRDDKDKKKGPPFCRNGEGHPVHGMEWCRDRGFDDGSIWSGIGLNDRDYNNGSYDRRHAEFHRDLDRRYEDAMSRRGVGLDDQLRLRIEKIREHDRWHDRMGIAH